MANGNGICCICEASFKGLGFNAEPFTAKRKHDLPRCCEHCNLSFVQPVRMILGPQATAGLLQILRAIAREGRSCRESNAISQAMLRAAHEPDS